MTYQPPTTAVVVSLHDAQLERVKASLLETHCDVYRQRDPRPGPIQPPAPVNRSSWT